MIPLPRQQLPDQCDDLSGVQKAAILLLALDHESSAALLRELPDDLVAQVTTTIATVRDVPKGLSESVVQEFYNVQLAGFQSRSGGIDSVKTMLSQALGVESADRILQSIEEEAEKRPFSFLHGAEPGTIRAFIRDEHPQTISLVMSYLDPEDRSAVLSGLPAQIQIEVVRRIAIMDQTSPEVIEEVEAGLRTRFAGVDNASMERLGGVDAAAEILNQCDRSMERTILEALEESDATLATEIRKRMFVFEDILNVNDKGVQGILKEVDNDELCISLKTASEELKEKIFSNMSTRAADLIKEDMQYMGPLRVSDVEAAQQRIVEIVRRLEEAGEIIIMGRGGESDLVV